MSKPRRKHVLFWAALMLFVCSAFTAAVYAGTVEKTVTPLTEYWSEGSPVAEELRNYVSKVTDVNDKENFIPKEDRIAVFDMDGTLTCETFFTYYDTMMFIDYCNNRLDSSDWLSEKDKEELKSVADSITPDYKAGEALARDFARAYTGMTVQELYDYAVEFGQKETASFNNMRYIDGFYLPMVELVKYLYDNDFTIYVISGTERTTSRAIVGNSPIKDYVTPSHVIGTEFEIKLAGNEKTPSNMDYKYGEDGKDDPLVVTGGFIQKNLNANKTIFIEREIGQRPVLAFGNSGSDTSMMNYAIINNKYPAEAFMVVADDTEREWGPQDWDEKSAEYIALGYVPVSMKNDFAQIYPEQITKAELQYQAPETAEQEAPETEAAAAVESGAAEAAESAESEPAEAAEAVEAETPEAAEAVEPEVPEAVEEESTGIEGLLESLTGKDGGIEIMEIGGLLGDLMSEDGGIEIEGLLQDIGADKFLEGLTDEDGCIKVDGLLKDLGLEGILGGVMDENGDIKIDGLLKDLGLEDLLKDQAEEDGDADIDYSLVFPSWNSDSATLAELIDFVADCTDEDSPNYLEPADRLAVFDMDGTILCEKAPVYIDYCMTMYRVLDDPSYKATEEERDAMQQIRDVAYSEGKTFHPETLTKDDLIASSFAGMTPAEFRSYVVNFADNVDAVGFEGMTYGESFYLPMIEVINFLKANDFDVWMVSACEREVVRALVERFDIPYDHVVATDVPYVASGKGDEAADDYNMSKEEEILLGAPLDPVECGKSGKSAAIAREIGKRPVLAFGNSSGDYSMLNYAEGNTDHEGKGFFVVCDDTEREYGSDEKAAEYYDVVEKEGWTAISMAKDWATIYGENVQKTELPGAAKKTEEAA